MELPGRDIVVVAASAGGIEPLRSLLAALPADLPAAVLVVVHISPRSGTALPGILDRAGPLRAAHAVDGEQLLPGRVYVAPPDHHLLVRGDRVRATRGPRHNFYRPAADPLFMSAALEGGPRTLAVVLSGTLDDGARGCALVDRLGGLVAVQDPGESAFPGMPCATLEAVSHAEALAVPKLAEWIDRLSRTPAVVSEPPADREAEVEVEHFLDDDNYVPMGELTGFTCPECSGPLYEQKSGAVPHFGCRVGHGWSMESMTEGQGEAVERALWVAILRMEERLRVLGRMILTAEQQGRSASARQFRTEVHQTREAMVTLRSLQSQFGRAAQV